MKRESLLKNNERSNRNTLEYERKKENKRKQKLGSRS